MTITKVANVGKTNTKSDWVTLTPDGNSAADRK